MAVIEEKSAEKFLAYDGDCPMCQSTVAMLIGLKLIKPEQARSNHDLSATDHEAAYAAGMRNQLIVIDSQTRELRTGTDGLLWIVGDNAGNPIWVRLLSLPGVRQLLRRGYEIISYNRRIISPPRHQIVCDCEPEVTVARRLSLIVPTLTIMVLLAALMGAGVFYGAAFGSPFSGALFGLVAVLAGPAVLALAAAVLLPSDKRIDYVAHLVVTMFIGMLVLAPIGVTALVLPRAVTITLGCFVALASCGLMWAMQKRRVAALKLSRAWQWAWLASLAGSVAATTFFFFGR